MISGLNDRKPPPQAERMPLTDLNIDAITEADIAAAIGEGLRQGIHIAFAPAAYNHPFVKDVSSLANTRGGLMLLGIEDKYGVAAGFAALTGSVEAELQQLEKRLQDGISPPVPGVRLRAVELAGGGFVVVLAVPRSKQAPHRVTDPRDSAPALVYIRGGQGAIRLHPRAVDEMFG